MTIPHLGHLMGQEANSGPLGKVFLVVLDLLGGCAFLSALFVWDILEVSIIQCSTLTDIVSLDSSVFNSFFPCCKVCITNIIKKHLLLVAWGTIYLAKLRVKALPHKFIRRMDNMTSAFKLELGNGGSDSRNASLLHLWLVRWFSLSIWRFLQVALSHQCF